MLRIMMDREEEKGWSMSWRSFCAKIFDGVCEGGADGLEADSEEGDGYGQEAGKCEYPPGKVDPVGEVGQPMVHGKGCEGRANGECNSHQY